MADAPIVGGGTTAAPSGSFRRCPTVAMPRSFRSSAVRFGPVNAASSCGTASYSRASCSVSRPQASVLTLFSDKTSAEWLQSGRIYWQRNRLTPAEPLQHHAHTLTCRHAGEFQIVAGENVPGSLTFSFWPRVKKSLFGNRIGPLISFSRSSSTTMSATDAGLSSDIANTARLRGCALPFCDDFIGEHGTNAIQA